MLQSKSRLDMLENEDISEIYKYHIDNLESFTPDQRLDIKTRAMFLQEKRIEMITTKMLKKND